MTTTERFCSTRDVLRRSLRVLKPAAARRAPQEPDHFTHCVIIEPVGELTRLSVSDGFRMHSVLLSAEVATYHDDKVMAVGLRWLSDRLDMATDGPVELHVERRAQPHWDEWNARFEGKDHTDEQSFKLPGKLPNIDGLIEHGEIEMAVGFNPIFFFDMVTAAKHWWDQSELDKAFPLVVQEMHPEKTCIFTIRNSYGLLRMTLMPKVLKEDDQ